MFWDNTSTSVSVSDAQCLVGFLLSTRVCRMSANFHPSPVINHRAFSVPRDIHSYLVVDSLSCWGRVTWVCMTCGAPAPPLVGHYALAIFRLWIRNLVRQFVLCTDYQKWQYQSLMLNMTPGHWSEACLKFFSGRPRVCIASVRCDLLNPGSDPEDTILIPRLQDTKRCDVTLCGETNSHNHWIRTIHCLFSSDSLIHQGIRDEWSPNADE